MECGSGDKMEKITICHFKGFVDKNNDLLYRSSKEVNIIQTKYNLCTRPICLLLLATVSHAGHQC